MLRRILSFIIALIYIVSLSSCIARPELRPQYVVEEIWACEEPFVYFQYSETTKHLDGEIYHNGEVYHFFVVDDSGLRIQFLIEGAIVDNCIHSEGNTIFAGLADYQEGYFDLEVTEDYENIFGGELPVIRFTRYTVDEFNEKFGEIELVTVDDDSTETK